MGGRPGFRSVPAWVCWAEAGGTEGARCDLRGSGVSDVVPRGDVGRHRNDNAGGLH